MEKQEMISYREEPVGVVGTFTVRKTYSVTVYADREDDLDSAIEELKISEDDLIDIEYELEGVDSAAL
jgi:hypothetical protein